MHTGRNTQCAHSVLVWMRTHTHTRTRAHTMEAYTVYTNTDEDKYSAADCGVQQAQYDEMDTADQLQQKLNKTVRHPFSILPVTFPFLLHETLPPSSTSPDSTIIIHSPSSALHLSSLLLQYSYSSFLFPSFPLLSLPPPSHSGFGPKTHTQTDSRTERRPRSDPRSEL